MNYRRNEKNNTHPHRSITHLHTRMDKSAHIGGPATPASHLKLIVTHQLMSHPDIITMYRFMDVQNTGHIYICTGTGFMNIQPL